MIVGQEDKIKKKNETILQCWHKHFLEKIQIFDSYRKCLNHYFDLDLEQKTNIFQIRIQLKNRLSIITLVLWYKLDNFLFSFFFLYSIINIVNRFSFELLNFNTLTLLKNVICIFKVNEPSFLSIRYYPIQTLFKCSDFLGFSFSLNVQNVLF